MNSEDIKAVFGMKPEAAVAYLKQKGIVVSWDWQDMLDDAHATALYVAKTAKNGCSPTSIPPLSMPPNKIVRWKSSAANRPRLTTQRLVGQAGKLKIPRRNPSVQLGSPTA